LEEQDVQNSQVGKGEVIFAIIGRLEAEHIAELETLMAAETKGRRIILDLKDMTLTVKRKERIPMSQNNGRAKRSEKGLLTPDNCAVAFIDHQPQMLFFKTVKLQPRTIAAP
jgi:hypothetical protein